MRFFPSLKTRCDYGLSIFILTFSLISVSGYRDNEVLHMAHQRVSTIIIGSCTAIIVCIGICPVWVGEELHNLVSSNMEKLGNFLEGTLITIHNTFSFSINAFFFFCEFKLIKEIIQHTFKCLNVGSLTMITHSFMDIKAFSIQKIVKKPWCGRKTPSLFHLSPNKLNIDFPLIQLVILMCRLI